MSFFYNEIPCIVQSQKRIRERIPCIVICEYAAEASKSNAYSKLELEVYCKFRKKENATQNKIYYVV